MTTITEKLFTITFDLFDKDFQASYCKDNLKNFSGRGKDAYEFHIEVFAKSSSDAIKKAKKISESSSWIKLQDTKTRRRLTNLLQTMQLLSTRRRLV